MNDLLDILQELKHPWVNVELSKTGSAMVSDEGLVCVVFCIRDGEPHMQGQDLQNAILRELNSPKPYIVVHFHEEHAMTMSVFLPDMPFTEMKLMVQHVIGNVEKWISVLPELHDFENQARLAATELIREMDETPGFSDVVERMGYSTHMPGAYENAVRDGIRDMLLEE